MGEVTMWLPEGLDLRPRMERAGLADQTVYAEWMVSEVVRWSQIYRVPDGEFVPLAFAHLRTGVPENLVGRLKRVLIPEVLETDGRYWFGSGEPGKCLGYRLTADAAGTPARVSRQSAWLHRKLTAAEAELARREEQRVAKLSPLYRTLRRHMRSAWLADDARADPHPIVEFLAGNRPRWFVVCPQGRVHHPVAGCPRRLRPHLRLADPHAPLALVDVSTCQPLLLGLTIAVGGEERSETAPARFEGHDACEKTTNQPTTSGQEGGQEGHLYSPDSDTRAFVSGCLSGDLYSRLADAMSVLSTWTEYTRNDAKAGWMKAIYGEPWLMDKQLAGRALRCLYPVFFRRVRAAAEAGGRGHLARALQRLEAQTVIGGVAAALVERHPTLPFITVHDAVLCLSAHAPIVERVFAEEFECRFGVVPRLKVESLSG